MSRVPFEQLLSSEIFEDIESAQERETHPEYRVFPISQQKLLEDGRAILAESDDEEEQAVKKSETTDSTALLDVAKYTGNKWGGKYLRAPDIYWTIMEKGKDKLVCLGDVAEVRYGIKTSTNEFFYLDEASIRKWKIENEFLRPVIKSPRECKRILIDPNDLKFNVFICQKDKKDLKGTAALSYIEWGESRGFNKRASYGGRTKWWSLSLDTANSILVKEANETSAVFYNPQGYPVDCRLYYAALLPTTIAYLNSALGVMSFEIYNRAGLGEGARSLMVSDYVQVPVLAREQEAVKSVLPHIYALPPRKLTSLQEQAWLDIDTIIFDALNLTQNERDAVYEGAINLVNARLEKAKSFNAAKETRKRVELVRQLNGIWIGIPDVEDEEAVVEGYSA